MRYKTFATGDQLWYSERYGKQTVVKFITDDGLTWEEGQEGTVKLTGVEKFFHRLVVATIRLVHLVMEM